MTTDIIYKVLWVDDLNLDENNELTDFYEGWQLKAGKYNIELVPFDNWEEAEYALRKDFDDILPSFLMLIVRYARMTQNKKNSLQRYFHHSPIFLEKNVEYFLGIFSLQEQCQILVKLSMALVISIQSMRKIGVQCFI